jgi:hypothetical protein
MYLSIEVSIYSLMFLEVLQISLLLDVWVSFFYKRSEVATTISQQTWRRLECRALFVGLRCFDYCDGGLARSVSNIEAIIHHPSGKIFVLIRVCIYNK